MPARPPAADLRSTAAREHDGARPFPRASATAALVTSSAVTGLGLIWLLAPGLNPFAGDDMMSLVSQALGPVAVAAAALGLGLVGVLLAVTTLRGRRADSIAAPGGAVLAAALSITLGSVHVIAFAGYVFGAIVVGVGLVAIVVLPFRAPRLGLPLLGGSIVLIAASAWAGVTLDGITEFAGAFGRALVEDAPNLAVIAVTVAAMLTWAVTAVVGVGRTRGGRRFEAWLVRHRRPLTILAAAGPLPYGVARASWLTPWPLFGPAEGEGITAPMLATGLMLGAGAVAASVLTLGLILPWGVRFPRWIPRIGDHVVPAATAVVPGAVAAGLLCLSASPMLVSGIGDEGDPVSPLVVNLVLPFWYWGPMLALAVWAYAAWRRRGALDAA
ncbi:hypothetical protein [Agromyces salentinus]|uniref:Integral membrane protein n=1 Tax=Agromyces salentinus TaxID=269421 RepID=A0ABN2MW81_9MICO|nr:hypothetical protein [Agromyces salentinus]